MQVDIVVIGAGHAGVEAACAAARMGAQVALVTPNASDIGAMSCNPAIGGIGKGHLVREIDIFDGVMGRAADEAAIHYRLLNRSKGAAVRGPRVQADRARYRKAVKAAVGRHVGLTVVHDRVERLLQKGGAGRGVVLSSGIEIKAGAVVIATGTFLGARLYRGRERWSGGRIGECSAGVLADQLRDFGLPLGWLKTGTPPRLLAHSIDWGALQRQESDREFWTMSPMSACRPAPQIACGVTRTNERTHAIIADALTESPTFSGAIEGRGPRYCPSIEDKVVRFADRDSHQIFLEPEGLDSPLVYPNGISTSLPTEAQTAFVRSIEGLGSADIVEPGYAVEYAFLDPRALDEGLGLRAMAGLFCAGQINGTTGYEEAAGQGLIAGLSAAAQVLGRAPMRFDRAASYLGVMVDDLVTQGVTEPYRMLTARAEFRLSLRADNAASRLGDVALASGAISRERRRWIEESAGQRVKAKALIAEHGVAAAEAGGAAFAGCQAVLDEVLDDQRYAPYLARQAAEVARREADGRVKLDRIVRFADVPGLSNEMIERLEAARPETLATASRIQGVTPAALAALALAAHRRAA